MSEDIFEDMVLAGIGGYQHLIAIQVAKSLGTNEGAPLAEEDSRSFIRARSAAVLSLVDEYYRKLQSLASVAKIQGRIGPAYKAARDESNSARQQLVAAVEACHNGGSV